MFKYYLLYIVVHILYSGFVDFVFLKCTVYIYIYDWHYSLYAIFCILNMIFIYCMYIIIIDWLDDDFCLFCRFAWWKFSCDWTKRCIKCVQIFQSGSWEPIHCGTAGHIVIVIFRSSSSGHITETASWSPQMVVIFWESLPRCPLFRFRNCDLPSIISTINFWHPAKKVHQSDVFETRTS